MLSRIASLTARWPLADAVAQHGAPRVLLVAAFHVAALAVVAWTEVDLIGRALFFLAWGLVNFCWLVLLRRPGLSALLSLAMIGVLIVLSRFKSDNLWMTVSFVDIMIIDADTIAFLLQVFPRLRVAIAVGLLVTVPLAVGTWRLDPFRIRGRCGGHGPAARLGPRTRIAM